MDPAKLLNTKEWHKSPATEVIREENNVGQGQQMGRRTIAKEECNIYTLQMEQSQCFWL